jgi:aspartyl-tRNA(Asn)/glutamyl-tRNA(Gln) amidotransferase subunit C
MAEVSIDDVKKLAHLSKIKLSEAELKQYQAEITSILGFVEQLKSIDTTDVEETSQVTGLQNVTRQGVVKDYGVSKEELLKNAPNQEKGYIKVRRVL